MPDQPPLSARVTSYTVTLFKSDLNVAGREKITLTDEFGSTTNIWFATTPPPDWLTFAASTATVFLDASEFDRTLHLLQSERPVFEVRINLFGLRAFSLSTGTELPGEGPGDPPELAEFAARARAQHAATA